MWVGLAILVAFVLGVMVGAADHGRLIFKSVKRRGYYAWGRRRIIGGVEEGIKGPNL